jgi:SAM-dependent methyltransferase
MCDGILRPACAGAQNDTRGHKLVLSEVMPEDSEPYVILRPPPTAGGPKDPSVPGARLLSALPGQVPGSGRMARRLALQPPRWCMANHVCPWWLGYALVSPLRRLWQRPDQILAPYVRPGMLVLEPGCGMGFFTLDLARMVGPTGRVVAVDLQERMLAGLRRRARRAGLLDRIEARLAGSDRLGVADLAGLVDVAFALHVVHEVPDIQGFFAEIAAALKPDGRLLFVEPRGHVSEDTFVASLALAEKAGFKIVDRPRIRHEPAALLTKKEEAALPRDG